MKLLLPIKETVWGKITNQSDFNALIRQRGQFFGQDLSGRACDFNSKMPCDKTLYEYMGWGTHKGIDIPVATGTEVFSSTDGKVTRISDDKTQGIGVVIWDESQNIECVYWHLLSHNVILGSMVKAGDLIAVSDNTGYSLGSHLHFQVNQTDEHGKSGQAVDPINSFVWDDMLDQDDVRFLQALEGFHDETGVVFWGDGTHTLKEYEKARVPDKVKELTNLVLI